MTLQSGPPLVKVEPEEEPCHFLHATFDNAWPKIKPEEDTDSVVKLEESTERPVFTREDSHTGESLNFNEGFEPTTASTSQPSSDPNVPTSNLKAERGDSDLEEDTPELKPGLDVDAEDDCLPEAELLDAVRALPDVFVVSEQEMSAIRQLQADSYPPLYAVARQLPYEDIDAFLRRRSAENQRIIDLEPSHSREEREGRERRTAAKNALNIPPNCGLVFVWTFQPPNAAPVRTPVHPDALDDIWSAFLPHQRRFDAIQNEWDLCESFSLVAGSEENPSGRPSSFPDAVIFPAVGRDLTEAAFYRYGFVRPPPDATIPSGLAPYNFNIVAELLGCREKPEIEKLARDTTLLQFFQNISEASSHQSIHGFWHDLSSSQSALRREWPFRIVRVAAPLQTPFRVFEYTYVIFDKNPIETTVLLLHSATMVLEIIRHGWGPSITQVARELAARGITFRLAIRSPIEGPFIAPTNFAPAKTPPPSIPQDLDYSAYLHLIQIRVLETRRGRLAYEAGGFLARLARLAIPETEAIRGPAQDVVGTGHRLQVLDGTSAWACWFETLTHPEINLLVGEHMQSRQGKNARRVTWWPHVFPPHGSWTTRHELWFLNPHEYNITGRGSCWNSFQWQQKLKRSILRGNTLSNKYETLADEMLLELLDWRASNSL